MRGFGLLHCNHTERQAKSSPVCIPVRKPSSTYTTSQRKLTGKASIDIHTQGNCFNMIHVIMMNIIKLKRWPGQNQTISYACASLPCVPRLDQLQIETAAFCSSSLPSLLWTCTSKPPSMESSWEWHQKSHCTQACMITSSNSRKEVMRKSVPFPHITNLLSSIVQQSL